MKLTIKHAILSMIIFFSAGTAADTLKYAGEIADDAGNPLNGEYLMTFSLYDDPQGYIIWEETQNVIVQNGDYEVVLGTNNPINFPADKKYYLEITLGGSPELAAKDIVTPTGKKPKTFKKPVIITGWLQVDGDLHGAARDTDGNALRICTGRTTKGNTDWVQHSSQNGIYVDIDTSACNFTSTPIYISNLAGNANNWTTTGGSSPYLGTAADFRIYVHFPNITPSKANSWDWHINWMATGK
ncbi:MAG: hypothetical protein ABFS56_27805 [Pseudomonadota bacterium]